MKSVSPVMVREESTKTGPPFAGNGSDHAGVYTTLASTDFASASETYACSQCSAGVRG